MTLDARARRAAQSFRDAVEETDRSTPGRSSFERFDRFRRRKQRNARLGATLVACILAFAAIVFAMKAFPRAEQPAIPPVNNGRIVFVRYDHRSGEPVAFSMDPDGTDASQMFFSGFMSGHSEWPHWSPDGTQVTVFCCDDGKSPGPVDPDPAACSTLRRREPWPGAALRRLVPRRTTSRVLDVRTYEREADGNLDDPLGRWWGA